MKRCESRKSFLRSTKLRAIRHSITNRSGGIAVGLEFPTGISMLRSRDGCENRRAYLSSLWVMDIFSARGW